MINTELLDSRDEEIERNLKVAESKIEEIRLFDDSNPKYVRIGKNLPIDFKEKLVELLMKYHECFA